MPALYLHTCFSFIILPLIWFTIPTRIHDKEGNYPTIRHADIKFITSNNDCVYYISEKTESAIIRKTVESSYNGIWKLEVGSDKPTKIADECDCDEILATKNFLYCYTINYILPRGIANSWVKGYLINQLAIS